eukprot:TRINITY_DN341_c10_g1_i1.p1 TRINITY_DN341_c10_g1~~TRINITY_DN341_c10_g1_i1.p1  ORF type:complete len:120 (-),score=2.49 TRINITY_DN341_c10_g1_i1:50-409(-)
MNHLDQKGGKLGGGRKFNYNPNNKRVKDTQFFSFSFFLFFSCVFIPDIFNIFEEVKNNGHITQTFWVCRSYGISRRRSPLVEHNPLLKHLFFPPQFGKQPGGEKEKKKRKTEEILNYRN